MHRSIHLLSLFFLFTIQIGYSQSVSVNIDWNSPSEQINDNTIFAFSNSYKDSNSPFPFIRKRMKISYNQKLSNIQIKNSKLTKFSAQQVDFLSKIEHKLESKPSFRTNIVEIKGERFIDIAIYPITKDGLINEIEFEYDLVSRQQKTIQSVNFEDHSVLKQGEWFKIGIVEKGMYELTSSDLTNLGINTSTIDPKKIRIFGNGTGLLPEINAEARFDDLVENPIIVEGESDGTFNSNDKIIFYADGPNEWKYNDSDEAFHRQIHYYSDTNFYFLNIDLEIGKRVTTAATISGTPSYNSNSFDDYKIVEEEKYNLVNTGKKWYGQRFEITKSFNYNFDFPNRVQADDVKISIGAVARSSSTTSMNIKHNNSSLIQFDFKPTHDGGNFMESTSAKFKKVFGGTNLLLNVNYIENFPSSVAYLDFLEVNARRELRLHNGLTFFADSRTIGHEVTAFNIAGFTNGTSVWDISDIDDIKSQPISNGSFKANTNTMKQFVMFDGSNYSSPETIQAITNQDLHGISQADFIIVTYPLFNEQAERLADFHREQDNMTCAVVTTTQIYNEFSSGKQDITAIKDFVRMLYERNLPNNTEPKNLLLFGDGSFDYKDITPNNSNFVPTWESLASNNIDRSFATDDYFGMLDQGEGSSDSLNNEMIDIGIGRFIVQNIDEAKIMVDKVEQYYASSSFGNWRNKFIIVADDVDATWERDLARHANNLSNRIIDDYPAVNVKKIFVDAYVQKTSTGGQRYPEAENDINQGVENGSLIVHYYGHGGEIGWSSERILGNDDILGYQNINNMPLFITTTCEFSRYDDKDRISAGEYVLLNENGAGIALYTTTRSISIGDANGISNAFYNFIYSEVDGKNLNLGEIIRATKNDLSFLPNKRKLLLLGDPALTLAYPKNNIVTSQINDIDITNFQDTLKALSKVKISGEIRDRMGNKDSDFNGIVVSTIFDKFQLYETLNNDLPGELDPVSFQMQNSILYNGKSEVSNGEFSFEFIIPKDIKLDIGPGKISYYAYSEETDANGFTNTIKVGSINPNSENDTNGPVVQLFMNDESFVRGGYTNASPDIFALVTDSNGINTSGTGIGHDIAAILDNETGNTYVLNDFYEGALNDFTSGSVRFSLNDLESGPHNLQLKIWDTYNNSTTATTEFIVENDAKMALKRVLNWPNPFTTNTDFQFEHNHQGENIEVQIQIFTITGKLVKTINQVIIASESRVRNELKWDGLDDFGDKIGKGVYMYKLEVRTENGKKSDSKIEKLVILK